MNNKLTLIIFTVVALGVGIWLAGPRSGSRTQEQGSAAAVVSSAPTGTKPPALGQLPLETGQKAPDFSVTTVDRKSLTLADFSGKILVVTSGGAWCPTCIIENKNFQPVYQEFKGQGVEFLYIDIDPRDTVKMVQKFDQEYAPGYAVHSGKAQKMIKDYGFQWFEITYIIDSNGVITFADGRITSTETLRRELGKLL